LRGLEEKNFLS